MKGGEIIPIVPSKLCAVDTCGKKVSEYGHLCKDCMEKYIDESYIVWLCKRCNEIIDIVKDTGVYPKTRVNGERIIKDFLCYHCNEIKEYYENEQNNNEEGEDYEY